MIIIRFPKGVALMTASHCFAVNVDPLLVRQEAREPSTLKLGGPNYCQRAYVDLVPALFSVSKQDGLRYDRTRMVEK